MVILLALQRVYCEGGFEAYVGALVGVRSLSVFWLSDEDAIVEFGL